MNNIQDTNVNDLVEINKVNKVNKLGKTKRKNSFIKNENSIINKNNILEYYFNLPIKNKKAYIKIVDEDFSIPFFSEYNKLLINNYNVTQLKNIAKHYKLRTSGNKDHLKKYLYNYLYYNYKIIIIQKIVRSHIVKKYIKYHGPAFFKRSLCCNDVDFCTLDNLNKIPYNQFISFKDINNHIYGYDILSLYNLFTKITRNGSNSNQNILNNNLTNVQNPFTNLFFSYDLLKQLLEYIRMSHILKINIDLNYDDLVNLSNNKQIEMKILTLFQRIDSLGNYTNIKWFMDLDKYALIQFIRELIDIWNYRANLSQDIKREIVPPHGNPFYDGYININNLSQYNFVQIRKYTIYIIDLMVNKGINDVACSLGSYYILSALTLVSSDAAEALPWLYEAVNYQ